MLVPFARHLGRLCLLLTAMATIAVAQGAPDDGDGSGGPGGPPSHSWGIGVVGLAQQQAYAGIDAFYIALPAVYFENSWVQVMVPRVNLNAPAFKLGHEQELSIGAGVQLFGFNGYEPDDAPILDGMAERNSGLFAGPVARWNNPIVNVSAEWMLDASSNSTGQRVSLGLERTWFVGRKVMLAPSVTTTWLDADYADYYYGVRTSEARADRPAYVAGRTTTTDFSLRTTYLLDRKQALILLVQCAVLGNSIKDSPLVDRSIEPMILTGYLYRFR